MSGLLLVVGLGILVVLVWICQAVQSATARLTTIEAALSGWPPIPAALPDPPPAPESRKADLERVCRGFASFARGAR